MSTRRSITLPTRGTAGPAHPRHTTAPDPAVEADKLESLKHEFYREILRRLQAVGIVTDSITKEFVSWTLPSDRTPEAAKKKCWEQLLDQPMILSDAQLAKLFKVHVSTRSSPPHEIGTIIYYFRTFELRVSELEAIVGIMEQMGVFCDEAKAWMEECAGRDPNDTLYVRYVGCSGAVSGWQRMTEDASILRLSSLMGVFLDAWKQVMGPAVSKSAAGLVEHHHRITVHEFTDAKAIMLRRPTHKDDPDTIQLQALPLSKGEKNWREQILIQVLGYSTLLNRDLGGQYTRYHRPKDRVSLFKQLGTRSYEMMTDPRHYQAPSAALQQDIDSLLQEHQKYAKDKGLTVMSDAQGKAFARQAYSATHLDRAGQGHHLMLFLGEAPPLKVINGPPVQIWRQNSDSIENLQAMLGSLLDLENPSHETTGQRFEELANKDQVPWLDMWYYPEANPMLHVRQITELARKGVARIHPLIVVAFSRTAADLLSTDLNADTFKKQASRDLEAGSLSLHHYTVGQSGHSSGNPDEYFILLVCPHTGAMRYVSGEAQKQISDLIDLTLWKLLLLVDVACRHLAKEATGPTNRREMCTAICLEVNRRWQQLNLDKLSDSIIAARKTARAIQRSHHGTFQESFADGANLTISRSARRPSFWQQAMFYWARPASPTTPSENVRVHLRVPQHVCPGLAEESKQAPRQIFFTPGGIDIRLNGKPYNLLATGMFDLPLGFADAFPPQHNFANDPTLSGYVLRRFSERLASVDHKGVDFNNIKQIWEQETNLKFDQQFPDWKGAVRPNTSLDQYGFGSGSGPNLFTGLKPVRQHEKRGPAVRAARGSVGGPPQDSAAHSSFTPGGSLMDIEPVLPYTRRTAATSGNASSSRIIPAMRKEMSGREEPPPAKRDYLGSFDQQAGPSGFNLQDMVPSDPTSRSVGDGTQQDVPQRSGVQPQPCAHIKRKEFNCVHGRCNYDCCRKYLQAHPGSPSPTGVRPQTQPTSVRPQTQPCGHINKQKRFDCVNGRCMHDCCRRYLQAQPGSTPGVVSGYGPLPPQLPGYGAPAGQGFQHGPSSNIGPSTAQTMTYGMSAMSLGRESETGSAMFGGPGGLGTMFGFGGGSGVQRTQPPYDEDEEMLDQGDTPGLVTVADLLSPFQNATTHMRDSAPLNPTVSNFMPFAGTNMFSTGASQTNTFDNTAPPLMAGVKQCVNCRRRHAPCVFREWQGGNDGATCDGCADRGMICFYD
ncbi:hypothetical protein LTR17_025230 [Elasticomyces elasticus]|nr:hypothetical protein LTR17_025230 [Elasticomyces elasticus]